MNKTVLVVGAGGGVGLATTRLLLEQGYDVMATVSSNGMPDEVREGLAGARKVLSLDLSDSDSIGAKLTPHLSDSDIMLTAIVVCAGVCPYGPVETASLEILRRTLEINTVSNVAVYQTCMPYLRANKGRFIFISSLSGVVSGPMIGYYCASKFALEAIVDAMRRETQQSGVKIVLIQPGGIKTNMAYRQAENIHRDIVELSIEEDALYGKTYRGFQQLLGNIDQRIEPEVVAQTILDALEAPEPETRYPVGEDAVAMIQMAKNCQDREIDDMFREMYG